MGGPSGHGQKNKPHKAGNKGQSARQRHRSGKEAGPAAARANIKSAAGQGGKQERFLAAKQQRAAKREEALNKRRQAGSSPLVVALLPLSQDVDVSLIWAGLLAASGSSHPLCPDRPSPCGPAPPQPAASGAEELMSEEGMAGGGGGPEGGQGREGGLAGLEACRPLQPCLLRLQGRGKLQVQLLPPPADRTDPLSIVELGKVAEVVLLVAPGNEGSAALDTAGRSALAVLRALGCPDLLVAIQSRGQGGPLHPASAPSLGPAPQPLPLPLTAAAAGGQSMTVDEGDVEMQGGGEGVAGQGGGPGLVSMKQRSAARKRVDKALAAELPGDVLQSGRHLLHADQAADFSQLLRCLLERPAPALPHWRRLRPALLVEQATWQPSDNSSSDCSRQPDNQPGVQGGSGGSNGARPAAADDAAAGLPCSGLQQGLGGPQGQLGELALTGWLRAGGLSAVQLVHVPGAGDFQIERIEAAQPTGLGLVGGRGRQRGSVGGGGLQGEAMEEGGEAGQQVLAEVEPALREPLQRLNQAAGDADDEQTWPTEAEMEDASAAAASRMFQRRQHRKNVPQGTSEYQAAWIVDEDEDSQGEDSGSSEGDGDAMVPEAVPADDEAELPDIIDDAGTDIMGDDEGDEGTEAGTASEGGVSKWARMQAELRAAREAEGEDAQHPDEVDIPPGTAARVRLQKYRGLKSFRSSPWDCKEWLPPEYSRVFAFQNPKRTHKRAKEAAARASSGADPSAVPPGTFVRVVLGGVSAAQAAAVQARVAAAFPCPLDPQALPSPQPGQQAQGQGQGQQGGGTAASQLPLVAFGLLAHEAKLSVVHYSVRKASSYSQPLANKEELLLVTGLRSFLARPVFSTDTPGDKHKMERWLHAGQQAMATVFAPIAFPPLPLLAFKLGPDGSGPPRLAATGALRSCDPDRVVLKKIVLTGFPVRVHKRRCTVRYMFHDPDDIRWFRPVELYTRSGRRGRITEPLGTHGAMKTLFDGPVQQREVVCMSLYKRVFPKWPAGNDLTFA